MKRMAIVGNALKDRGFTFTKAVAEWLMEHGVELAFDTNYIDYTELPSVDDEVLRHLDALVVLGGDGTVLNAARRAAPLDVPILGINLGTVGYINGVERSDTMAALERTLSGDYEIDERTMLETRLLNYMRTTPSLALNEVCAARPTPNHLLEIGLYVNDMFISKYRCDGILVATPTGSTAYNLSSGGPIMKSDVGAFVVTPVCPHSLYSNRPMIISNDDVVTIKILNIFDQLGVLMTDGKIVASLNNADIIDIRRSECCAKIIKTTQVNFYDRLRIKLKGGANG